MINYNYPFSKKVKFLFWSENLLNSTRRGEMCGQHASDVQALSDMQVN